MVYTIYGRYANYRFIYFTEAFRIEMAWDFRKEEDVQKYLANLDVEYKFGCYQEKKPKGKVLVLLFQKYR